MFVTVNSLLCATLLKFPVFLPVFHSFMCKCVITIKTIGVQVGFHGLHFLRVLRCHLQYTKAQSPSHVNIYIPTPTGPDVQHNSPPPGVQFPEGRGNRIIVPCIREVYVILIGRIL
jgi:hypothetical protein